MAAVPVLLLPVRLEVFLPPPQPTGRELWVRIYPDVPSVSSHREKIPAQEQAQAKQLWAGIAAGSPPSLAQWAALVERFGAPRAAYVAHATAPGQPAAIVAGDAFHTAAR